jgi:RNA polymerase sigma-70 factor (ECF subfamily)
MDVTEWQLAVSVRNNAPRATVIKGASLAAGGRSTPGVTAAVTSLEHPISVQSRADEEQAFIDRCLVGDPESFRPLVQRYQRIAFSVALRMLGSRADAEDVAQQAFADAYAALDRFHGDGRPNAFSTWLLRIVVNRSKDVLKSKKRTESPLDADVAPEQAIFAHQLGGPEALLGQAQERQLLERALAKVPPKYREVLVLKDIEDLSYEEIRAILRLPITTLKIRVVRARAMMRSKLAGLRT